MLGCLRTFLLRGLGLLLLGALLWVAWTRGPDLLDAVQRDGSPPPWDDEPSIELAAAAVERYQEVIEGDEERAEFTSAELESVLRYRLPDYLPEGAGQPSVELREGEIILGLRVARTLLPDIQELQRVTEFLPDTVPVSIRGSLVPGPDREATFVVRRIDAAGIPIPRRFYPAIVAALDPRDRSELPAEAIPVPLPPGIRSAHVEGSRLVLLRPR